jgi:hypothetical protein
MVHGQIDIKMSIYTSFGIKNNVSTRKPIYIKYIELYVI